MENQGKAIGLLSGLLVGCLGWAASGLARTSQASTLETPIPDSLRVKPAEGAAAITLDAIDWCGEKAETAAWEGESREAKFKAALRALSQVKAATIGRTEWDGIREISRFGCYAPGSPERRGWVESFLQALANQTGMTVAHAKLLLKVANKMDGRDYDNLSYNRPDGCAAYTITGRESATEMPQKLLLGLGLGCATYTVPGALLWQIDRAARLDSPVKSLGWLNLVYATLPGIAPFEAGIMGWRDRQELAADELTAELDRLGVEDRLKVLALVRFYRTRFLATAWVKTWEQTLGPKDFAELTRTFDEAFDGWVKDYQSHHDAMEFVGKIEEAVGQGDRRLLAGCDVEARKLASALIMARKPKTAEDIRAAAGEPMATLILGAAFECERGLGQDLSAAAYAAFLARAPLSRGPRYAALKAVVQKVAEIKQMVPRFPVEPRAFGVPVPQGAFGLARIGALDEGRGVVEAVRPDGGNLRLSFRQESFRQPITKCVETNRIDRIEPDGTLVYRQTCSVQGYQNVTLKEQPVSVPADGASGVKPGAFVIFLRGTQNKALGVIQQVFPGKSSDRLINYFGVPLE